MAVTAQNRRAVGANFPPSPIDLDPVKELTERLARDYAKLAKDYADKEIGITNVPARIETDEQAGKVSDFVAQCRALIKEGDAKHKAEGETYLKLKRAVDAFFLRRKDGLSEALGEIKGQKYPKPGSVLARLADYHQAKQRAERERQEAARAAAAEAAAKAAEEARLAREEDERIKAVDREAAVALRWQAHAAEDAARAAAAIAAAEPIKSHIRGSLGSLTYGTERWDFEEDDPRKIPFEYLMTNRSQVMAAIANGVREIPGLRIFPVAGIITKR